MDSVCVDKLKDLNKHLGEAQKLLWERVQMGNWDGRASAAAALKALEHISKAEDIIACNLSQLPLPIVDKITGVMRD